MTNIQRHTGGKVHAATTSGMPYCAPNGRPATMGGVVHHTNATSYRSTAHPVDCLRCLALADSAASA